MLALSTWNGAAFTTFQALPGAPSASDGPSLAGGATIVTLAFRSAAGTLESATWAGPGFGAAEPFASDVPAAFGNSTPSVARAGIRAWGAYSGANDGLYVASRDDGAAWTTSSAIAGAGSKNLIAPTVAIALDGHPIVTFVRGGVTNDSAVCVSDYAAASWTAPVCIPKAFTSRSVGAAVSAGGALVVAWHGFLEEGIYAAVRSPTGNWSPVLPVDTTAGPAGAPVVVSGVTGADAEVLYAKAKEVRHARVVSDAIESPVSVGGTLATEVGATVY